MSGFTSSTSSRQCHSCGAMNIPSAIFCAFCGSKLQVTSSPLSNQVQLKKIKKCPSCGFENNNEYRYCYSCGAALSSNEPPVIPQHSEILSAHPYAKSEISKRGHSDFRIFWILFLGIIMLGTLIAGAPGAITVGGAVFPAIVILYYFYRRDPNKEPGTLVMKVFILGVLSAVPAVIIEIVLMLVGYVADVRSNAILWAAWQAFVVAAITEEWLKFETVKLGVWKHPEFDEPMDAVIYAVAAALGFAAIENVVYALNAGSSTIALLFMRGLLSVPLHAITGAFIGIGIAKWKFQTIRFSDVPFSRIQILKVPILIHGTFNFGLFLFGDIRGFLMGIVTLAVSAYALRKNLRNISEVTSYAPSVQYG